jgi:serine/threonine protein phosphatase 1
MSILNTIRRKFEKMSISGSLPPGRRVYAIGDIHGRLDLLDELLHMIKRYDATQEPVESTIIFLGDYVDRGGDSKGVIERLMNGLPEGMSSICLRGNHEEMLLRAFDDPVSFEIWTGNGGLATLASYGVDRDLLHGPFLEGMALDDVPIILQQFSKLFPEAHRKFLESLKVSVTVGNYFFVHAGVRPGVALDKQSQEDCLYIRREFLYHKHDFGKIVVHGHSPVPEPDIHENRIGIDTGAFYSGRLTALCLEGSDRMFLAT